MELHVSCRHHIVRQCALQVAAQKLNIEHGFGLPRRDIGHQTLVAGHVFAGHDHGFAYIGVFGQTCFDFTQLHAQAADFHLIIVAPQVVES
ncbi:hypothetical protein ALQ99_03380, partial [Pseudomonas syringae pv. lapsa]